MKMEIKKRDNTSSEPADDIESQSSGVPGEVHYVLDDSCVSFEKQAGPAATIMEMTEKTRKNSRSTKKNGVNAGRRERERSLVDSSTSHSTASTISSSFNYADQHPLQLQRRVTGGSTSEQELSIPDSSNEMMMNEMSGEMSNESSADEVSQSDPVEQAVNAVVAHAVNTENTGPLDDAESDDSIPFALATPVHALNAPPVNRKLRDGVLEIRPPIVEERRPFWRRRCVWYFIITVTFALGTAAGIVVGVIKHVHRENSPQAPDDATDEPTLPPTQPPTSPPMTGWVQLGKTIYGRNRQAEWGEYLELSGDGRRLAVGSEEHGNHTGLVAVFEFDSDLDQWTQLGSDIVGEVEQGEAGKVAISADGNTLAIGSTKVDPNSQQKSGYVRLYRYNPLSKDWEPLGQIIPGESADDRFGRAVTLSANGTIVAAGAVGDDDEAPDAGQARVFEYDEIEEKWIQLGQDLDGPSYNSLLGYDVSLSADGMTIGVGGYRSSLNGKFAGLVHVYTYDREYDRWTQLGQDLYGHAEHDEAGRSVSLSDNGRVVALGAFQNDDGGEDAGHVRVYRYSDTDQAWVPMGQWINGEAAGDKFGRSVSLSGNGYILAAGGYWNDAAGFNAGHIRAFQYNFTRDRWEQIGPAMNGDEEDDWFGEQVSIAKDGRTVASGGPFHSGPAGYRSGNVKVYSLISSED